MVRLIALISAFVLVVLIAVSQFWVSPDESGSAPEQSFVGGGKPKEIPPGQKMAPRW